MTERPLTTTNRLQSCGWLVLAIALGGGCGSRSVVPDEPPPPAIDTHFERLPELLAGIQAGEVSLYEGLPDSFWEPDLRGHELKRKKTIRLHGYPFYEEKPTLKEADNQQLTATFYAASSFAGYSGLKSAGEYNPDYCISWKSSGGETQALVSLECAEVKLYGPKSELHCDLTPQAAEQLKQLLQPYRKNRPAK